MAKKELVVINETKRNKCIERFNKVNNNMIANLKRDTWKVAHMALTIIESDDFTESFNNEKDFASAVGYTAGAMSKLKGCAKIDVQYKVAELGLTTGQVQELIPLYNLTYSTDNEDENCEYEKDYLGEFIEREPDLCNMKTVDIRALVNAEMTGLLTDSDESEGGNDSDESEGNNESEVTEPENNDETIKTAEEILNEIIPVVTQARDKFVETEDINVIKTAMQAIYNILKGEELI